MLGTKLKNNKWLSNNPKFIIGWIVRIIAIIVGIFVVIIDNDNKILKLFIVGLMYVNVMLMIRFMVNQFRVYTVWNILGKSINDIEKNKKSLKKVKELEFISEYEVGMGKHYGKSINNIKEILDFVLNGVNKTVKNEKMNIELVNNITKKLDKPLNDVLDNIEMLNKYQEKEKKSLEILSEKSNNLKILIEELFEASKIASGDLEIEVEDIEIVELLKQSIVEFKDTIDSSTLNFKVNLPKERILIKGNGEKLWRVFNILIENTLKHSLDKSRVYVDVVNDDEKVYIRIKNTSQSELNIEVKDLVYIMNSNEDESASGLGLEIAKNLAIIQNGELNLDIDGDLFKVEVAFVKVSKDDNSLSNGVEESVVS